MTQALELIEVSVDYHRGGQPVHALDSASLAIGRSESVAVMGPSGCGKSTLLGVLALTIPPGSGSVLVSGVPAPSSPDGEPGPVTAYWVSSRRAARSSTI